MLDPALLPALHDALVVLQTSSIGEAARRLAKTPSAVSQQLRRIEEQFGVRLFEKVGRGIRPSPAGEAALGALTRVFEEASSLGTLLADLGGTPVTTLRLAASDYLGEALLIPVMRELAQLKIPLHFEITTTHSTEAARLTARGEVDLAIVSGARVERGQDLDAGPGAGWERAGWERPQAAGWGGEEARGRAEDRALFPQPFFWVAPRVRGGPRRVTARLGREPLLRLQPGSRGRLLLDEFLGRTGIRPPSTIDMPSVSLMMSYASRGLGIGLAPGLATLGLDRRKVLVEPADVPALEVRLLYRPGLDPSGPARSFLDRLVVEAERAAARL